MKSLTGKRSDMLATIPLRRNVMMPFLLALQPNFLPDEFNGVHRGGRGHAFQEHLRQAGIHRALHQGSAGARSRLVSTSNSSLVSASVAGPTERRNQEVA